MAMDMETGVEVDVTTLPANVKMFRGDKIKNISNASDGQGGNLIAKALADGWSMKRPEAK